MFAANRDASGCGSWGRGAAGRIPMGHRQARPGEEPAAPGTIDDATQAVAPLPETPGKCLAIPGSKPLRQMDRFNGSVARELAHTS